MPQVLWPGLGLPESRRWQKHSPTRTGRCGIWPDIFSSAGSWSRTSMTQTLGQTLLLWYSGFVLIFFLATNSYYLALTVIGFQRLSRVRREAKRADRRRLLRSPLIPPVSILAPVCNEEANVVENVRSLLSLDYPLFEVVLVNDGSEDQTLGRLIETFDLKPSARTYEPNLR